LLGRLEAPVKGTRLLSRELLTLSGWALSPAGIRQIEIVIDGTPRGDATYGSLRPDIGRIAGKYSGADHCGFHGVVSIHGLAEGPHELQVKVTANDGQVMDLSQGFTVDSAAVIDGGLPAINREYASWLAKRAAIREESAAAAPPVDEAAGPELAVVVVLDGGAAEALPELIASLQAQQYDKWRVTLVDRGCESEPLATLVAAVTAEDPRVDLLRVPAGTSLAAAWNAGGQHGTADWVGFFTSDVRFPPEAFATVARSLADDPADIIYSDDDRLEPETGVRWNPFFKPDWSPHLLLAMPYFGPLTFYRRSLLDAVGWLREGYEEAERYDLALRATEHATAIRHLPDVLVTTVERAPAHGVRWPATTWLESERAALRAALDRRGIAAIVERGLHPGRWRVRYPFREPPGVTVVIPTGGNLDLLGRCIDDLLHATHYPNLEIVIVDNSLGDAVTSFVAALATRQPRVRRVDAPIKPFNFSALINAALPLVESPYVLLLNDDIGVIEAEWLTAMVELATRPEVGIVGAKLLFPDDTIQHAGVVLGPFEGSVHVFKRFHGDDPGFFDLPDVTRDLSAVTFACALIDRAVFDAIGGLDDVHLPVAFNDTDFCLRAREAGFAVVYTPHATLYHHESVTKTVIAHPQEVAFVRNRWRQVIAHDPYYNPNLSRRSEDARLNTETLRVR
jgi:GT2 family glycosyltransferase